MALAATRSSSPWRHSATVVRTLEPLSKLEEMECGVLWTAWTSLAASLRRRPDRVGVGRDRLFEVVDIAEDDQGETVETDGFRLSLRSAASHSTIIIVLESSPPPPLLCR